MIRVISWRARFLWGRYDVREGVSFGTGGLREGSQERKMRRGKTDVKSNKIEGNTHLASCRQLKGLIGPEPFLPRNPSVD